MAYFKAAHALKRHPLTHGKEATFWHMIQGGQVEEERTPDPRRCERIRWPGLINTHAGDPAVKIWRNQRGREERVCLWFEEEDYLVIPADRGDYILPWTAYLVAQPHRKRKLLKEYEDHRRGRPWDGLGTDHGFLLSSVMIRPQDQRPIDRAY
ncbi:MULTISPECIES: hypothetical protein [unclassified Thiocapsa]|uniref:hypothetical protein n=1 Tax=unclassified Thiocapsa TaxID=2641286 RepID=UPI0035B03E83